MKDGWTGAGVRKGERVRVSATNGRALRRGEGLGRTLEEDSRGDNSAGEAEASLDNPVGDAKVSLAKWPSWVGWS